MSTDTSRLEASARREALSRERVLAAALALIDREGIEGLSMRKLGAALGVEAMSLYNHVKDKDDVLDGVVGLLWREVGQRTHSRGPWQEQARALAAAIRATAHAHPRAYPLVLTRGTVPLELLEVAGGVLEALRAGGFGALAQPAMLTLGSHATSQALAELSWFGDCAAQAPHAVPAEAPQPVVDAAEALAACDCDHQFELGLELIITGLEALSAQDSAGMTRAESRPARPA